MTINASNTDAVSAIKELTHGGANVSIDALGSATTCYNSIACLAKRGRHIQIGLMAGQDVNPKIPMHLVIANELQILGSHGMPSSRYPAIFELMKSKKIRPEIMVTNQVSLEDAIPFLTNMDRFENVGITVINRF